MSVQAVNFANGGRWDYDGMVVPDLVRKFTKEANALLLGHQGFVPLGEEQLKQALKLPASSEASTEKGRPADAGPGMQGVGELAGGVERDQVPRPIVINRPFGPVPPVRPEGVQAARDEVLRGAKLPVQELLKAASAGMVAVLEVLRKAVLAMVQLFREMVSKLLGRGQAQVESGAADKDLAKMERESLPAASSKLGDAGKEPGGVQPIEKMGVEPTASGAKEKASTELELSLEGAAKRFLELVKAHESACSIKGAALGVATPEQTKSLAERERAALELRKLLSGLTPEQLEVARARCPSLGEAMKVADALRQKEAVTSDSYLSPPAEGGAPAVAVKKPAPAPMMFGVKQGEPEDESPSFGTDEDDFGDAADEGSTPLRMRG